MANTFKTNALVTKSINLSGVYITSQNASSATVLYGNGTWAVPPGGGSTVYKYLVDVNFGNLVSGQGDTASITVSGSSGVWVSNTSVIKCVPMGIQTTDHSGEDVILDEVSAYATNIVSGLSFDVIATATFGAHGIYKIGIIGQ